MANPEPSAAFLEALKREGVTVIEHGDWRNHNRNHKGPWGPVHGVMIHHTVTSGTAGSVDLCTRGRPDLPGPLCHGVIDKQGRVHLVGHGRTNHAGMGDDDVLRAVIAENELPPPNETNTDGNARFYGWECINLGDGEDPWPAAQLDGIERASAAVCRLYDWGAWSVIGHKEWTNQKIDPRGFSMDGMRERIAERLRHAAGWTRGEDEDDVPDFVGMSSTKPQELTDAWRALPWDDEHVDQVGDHKEDWQRIITGPAKYTGTVYVRADQLTKPSDQLLVRVVEVDGEVKTSHPVGEYTDTPGKEYFAFPITGNLPKGRHLIVQVKKNGSPGIEVTANVKLLVWK